METKEILQGIHDWTNGKIVYDISVAHPDGQGKPTPYADLTAALGTGGANIPESLRKGGMSIKFIKGSAQSSDNKYVEYFLTKNTWSASEADWEKVNLEEEVRQLGQQVNNIDGLENLINFIDSEKLLFEQGTFNNSGAEGSSQSRIRCIGAVSTQVGTISVPSDFLIHEVFYYSSWVDNSNFVLSKKVNVGARTYEFEAEQILARFSIKKENNSDFTPDDFYNKLPIINNVTEYIKNKKNEINRSNTNNNYIGARALFERFQNIDGALDTNVLRNLFITKCRNLNTDGTLPSADSSNSNYSCTDYIQITTGHKYLYKLGASTSVYIIAEYNSSKEFLQSSSIKGNGAVRSGFYIPSANAAYVACCGWGVNPSDILAFIDVTEHLYAFQEDMLKAILDTDLTYIPASANIANPANIFDGGINDSGQIRDGSQLVGWKAVKVSVVAGQVVSFGGFKNGRRAYGAFYNGSTIVGTRFGFDNPNGSYNSETINLTVPTGATDMYIDIKTNSSPNDWSANALMVNIGSTLLPYESFKQKISKIKGYEISGADETLEPRVETLEATVSQQGDTIITLNSRVDILEDFDIVEDLPVSDGTDISVGYAYIDNATGVVKVKMS